MSKKEKNQNIQVYVRCRPINNIERKANSPPVVDVNAVTKEIQVRERLVDKDYSKKFVFDRVFGPEAPQVDVYKTVVGNLIEEVLLGYNCTVFAYGQTGTGKTHTMQGCKSADDLSWEKDPQSGIIPRAVHHLFDSLAMQDSEYNIRVSFIELYNEELFDLLAPLNDMSKLRIFEDSTKKGSVVIQGLAETMVHNKDEVYAILERGAEKRRVASTLMNDTSSRSHTVFSITVHIKENTLEGEDLLKIGKLNLVDLAGSECIGRSGAIDRRAREAGSINQSLLTLGRVITALVEKTPHVPYRESKLTRLLQDSLGGRTKTSIIATISPALCNLEETLSTLDYAHRAKNITNKPEVNQKLTKKALIREYTEEIERLRRDLIATRDKNGIFVDEENYRNMEMRIAVQSDGLKEKLADIEALKEQLEQVNQMFEFTQEKLKTSEANLVTTRTDLNKTEKKLNDTKEVLKSVSQSCEEQKFLVSHQAGVEKVLTSQANQLLGVAELTSDHVSRFWKKLEKGQQVEEINRVKTKGFREYFHDKIRGIEETVNNLFLEQNEYMGHFANDLLETSKLQCMESSSKQMNLMAQLSQIVAEQNSQLSEHITSTNNAILEQAGKLGADSTAKMEKLIASQTEFRVNTFQITMNEMTSLISNQTKIFCQLQETSLQHLQKIQRQVSASKNDIQNAFQGLKELASRMSLHNQSCLAKIEEQKTQLEKEQSSFLKGWKSEREGMMNMWQTAMNSMDNFVDSHRQVLEERLPKVWEQTNSMTVEEQNASAVREALTVKLEELMNEMESSTNGNLTVLHQDLETLNQTGQIQASKLEDTRRETSTLVHTNMSSLEKIVKNNEEILQHELQQLADNIDKGEEQSHELLQKHLSLNTSKMADLSDAKVQQDQQLIKLNQGLTDHAEDMNKMAIHWKPLVVQNLEDQHSYLDHFIQKELLPASPTGQTPERCTYDYPKDLAATSPHERILNRLRKHLDLDRTAQTSLPIEICDLEVESTDQPALDTLHIPDLNVSQESTGSFKSLGSYNSDSAPNLIEGNVKADIKENRTGIKKPSKRYVSSQKHPGNTAAQNKTPINRKRVLVDSNLTPQK